MPSWLSFPFPSPSRSCRPSFPASWSRVGLDERSSTLMVPIWHPESFTVAPRIWKGRGLLERCDLDANELYGPHRTSRSTYFPPSCCSCLTHHEQKYAAVEGPYQEQAKKIYNELRTNIIDNIFKEYERTGYVWEQYNSQTGEGRRSHPFTGWTSLVTLSKYEFTFPRRYGSEIPSSHLRKVLIRISVLYTDYRDLKIDTHAPNAALRPWTMKFNPRGRQDGRVV